jgi:hypothetical protein
MVKHLLFVILTLAFLGSCAAYRDVYREQLASLPQRYSQFDMRLAWSIKVVGTETLIDGVLENIRYPQMGDIEVWVSARDAGGSIIARSVSYIIPRDLRRDEVAPFSLRLPVAAEPGAKLLFTYRYHAHEDVEDGTTWLQSFEAEVPGKQTL